MKAKWLVCGSPLLKVNVNVKGWQWGWGVPVEKAKQYTQKASAPDRDNYFPPPPRKWNLGLTLILKMH